MAPSPGFAPGTFRLTGEHSAGLSYEGINITLNRIRTDDIV